MDQLYKKIYKVGRVVFYFILFVIKVILYYPFRFSTDFVYKGVKQGKVHVLGNGPSLYESLTLIERDKDDVIMVNYSPLTDVFWKLKPKYLCLLDPAFFEETYMLPDELNKKKMYDLLEKVKWELTIVVSSYYKADVVCINNNKVSYRFVNYVSIGYDVKFIRYCFYKYNLSVPDLYNVVVLAIYISLQMGYEKVFIHGVDSDLFKRISINEKNEIIMNDVHYYDNEKRNLNKEKFHGYITGFLYKYLQDQAVVFKSYVDLKKYSDYLGVEIFNVSPLSMIDAFKRIKISSKQS